MDRSCIDDVSIDPPIGSDHRREGGVKHQDMARFLSTFVSGHRHGPPLPAWFLDKWDQHVVTNDGAFPIASRHEGPMDGLWELVCEDLQRAIVWGDAGDWLALVFLHECGGVTRVGISAHGIRIREPEPDKRHAWCEVDRADVHFHYADDGCARHASL